jgi:hypothetical protein
VAEDAKLPDPAQIITIRGAKLVGSRNPLERRGSVVTGGLVQKILATAEAGVEAGAEKDERDVRADHLWQN